MRKEDKHYDDLGWVKWEDDGWYAYPEFGPDIRVDYPFSKRANARHWLMVARMVFDGKGERSVAKIIPVR